MINYSTAPFQNTPAYALRWIVGVAAALIAVTTAQADVVVEAYSGQPLGVGKVTISLNGASVAPMSDDRLLVDEASDRVLYPVAAERRVRTVLRGLLGIDAPRSVTYYFLFLGDAPLELEVYTPERQQITYAPQRSRDGYAQAFADWWKAYVGLYERVHRQAEYPVGVQTYLTSLWAERLQQPMPQLEGFLLREHEQGGTIVGKLTADEAYRAAVLRDLMLGRLDDAGELEPLPESAVRVASDVMPTAEVELEPLALRVPAECFYVRFGSFTNYLWFRDFMRQWQGDVGNMLVLRSIRRDTAQAISDQLGLKESKLAAVLGPQVIEDVAIIGMDPYFRDGAAVGVLFHAKNNFLLRNDLNRQRKAAADLYEGGNMETMNIAGREVSFASSPDGQLRSYYAAADNFHLVTTSRAMVERFFEAGAGEAALAGEADFLAARQRAPVAHNHTVFVHLSQAFLEQLVSPAYRIELDRRLRSIESHHALKLARLAAAQERLANETVDDLVLGGFLPPSFDIRSDDAKWETDATGRDRETVRGYPGRFVPIADNLPNASSPAERERYYEFAQSLADEVGGLVPLTACLHREVLEGDGRQRMDVYVYLSRYSTTNLASWAKKLGPASPVRVAPIAGDVASLEVVLDGLLGGGEPFHVFGGLRDGVLPLGIRGGGLTFATSLTDAIEGYLGAWPRPHFLLQLLGRPRGPYDAEGFARTGGLFDLWTRRADDFLLFSFKRHVLVDVGRQLAIVEAPRPAQAWLWIADLVGTQYEYAANAFGYARARQTSASGSRFMNSLTQQLHVDKQLAAGLADELVDGQFVCPLGGEYLLIEIPGGVQAWASTAAAPNNQFLLAEIPPGYRLPLLGWFRGLTAELTRAEDSLSVAMSIMMTPKPEDGAEESTLPPPPADDAPAESVPAERVPAAPPAVEPLPGGPLPGEPLPPSPSDTDER